jgi:hypothetical protein
MTEVEIIIDNDVILDGEGNLTIDENDGHRLSTAFCCAGHLATTSWWPAASSHL